jgi:uncharacterized protein (TIGR00661 family)
MVTVNKNANQKTICFSACGIGLGHVGRLKPLARWMHEQGHRIYFTGYGESLDQLKEDKFPVYRVPEIKFYENADGSFNGAKTSILSVYLISKFMSQVKKEFKYLLEYKPDIVISDASYSAVFAAKKYKMGYAPEMPILFITNQLNAVLPTPNQIKGISWLEKSSSYLNMRIIGMADKVLIQDLLPPYTISTTDYKVPDWIQHRFEYIGFIIRNTPEQLADKKTIRQELGFDDEKVIFAPIAGPIGARIQLKELLKRALKNFDGKVLITMGMYGKNLKKKFGSVEVISWLDNRFEMLKAADVTIARPGLATIGDFLRFGIPSILIPTLNHPEQLNNAENCEKLGVSKLVDQKTVSKGIINENIDYLLADTQVKRSTKKMQKIMKENNGLNNLKKIILEHLKD